MPAFSRAIVRPPGPTFSRGLTTAGLGEPDLSLALVQHAAYRRALEAAGVELIELPASDAFPDATFVEDVAVVVDGHLLLTRPGAASRRGEIELIRDTLCALFERPAAIEAPGTLDGGDVCDAGDRLYVGVSARTNPSGAEQLARWAEPIGKRTEIIDIRRLPGLLHLKSALAYVGEATFLVAPPLRDHPGLGRTDVIPVDASEAYAANCIEVNGTVFVPARFPGVAAALRARGFELVALEMSEFEKMDGGLSCLSLRF